MQIMNEVLSPYHQTKEQLDQEKILIVEAQKDKAKFATLYKKYFEQIFLFILKRVESEDTAADITSQVFLKALINLPKYRDMGLPFSSWLFRIARNELYDMYNQKQIEMVVSLESKGIGQIIDEIGDEQKEDHTRLTAALALLEENEMELIELRFFEKRAFKEIGEILDITENNAKVRTYRILDKLKKILSNEKR
jgi:RNA polymerase sigma-70 factor, ECF subfamily